MWYIANWNPSSRLGGQAPQILIPKFPNPRCSMYGIIYLHLVNFYGKIVGNIYHTLGVWE